MDIGEDGNSHSPERYVSNPSPVGAARPTTATSTLLAWLSELYDRSPLTGGRAATVIDRLREQIQQRLDQLAGETDRLRQPLAALDPRSPATTRKAPARKAPARKPAQASPAKPKAAAAKSAPAGRTSKPAARSPRRTASGATKASVLGALAGGEAMTAGQDADSRAWRARPFRRRCRSSPRAARCSSVASTVSVPALTWVRPASRTAATVSSALTRSKESRWTRRTAVGQPTSSQLAMLAARCS